MERVTFLANKLIRDKLIEKLTHSGIECNFKVLSDAEYMPALRAKVCEETQEISEAKTRKGLVVEIADLLEVLDALCLANNISKDEISEVKRKKADDRGTFQGRFFVKTFSMNEDHPDVAHYRKNNYEVIPSK